MADLATLQIRVDATGAIRVVDQFGNKVDSAANKTKKLSDAAAVAGTTLGTTLAAGLALVAKETSDGQREQALLETTLRATGNAAERSMRQLEEHADSLRRVTAFGGGDIAAAQARLLSYTGIVGDNFDRATQLALDYAQAFTVDVVQASEAVGKALNYPTKGMDALSKQGFILAESQKALIKEFEETNQLAKAQAILFEEIESITDGQAAAYRNTLGGALAAVREAFLDLFDASGSGMQGMVQDINLLADMLGTIPTRLEIIKESFKNVAYSFDSFFAPLLDLLPGVSGANLERKYEESNQYLRDLRNLLSQQEAGAIAGFVARGRAGRGRGAIGGGIGEDFVGASVAEYDKAVNAVLDRFYSDAAEAFAFRMDQEARLNAEMARVRADLFTGEFARQIGEITEASVNFGDVVVRTGDEWERINEHLGNNFRENMQRAFGDVLTQFVTQGKVSLQSMFASVSQMGASMMSQAVSLSMNRALSGLNLGAGASFGLGAGLGLIGMGAQAVFNANARRRQQRAAAAAQKAAEEERNRIAAADLMAKQNAAKEAEDERMRQFIAGRTGGRGGVIQSVGQVLQETSASRMIGELVAIRIATTRTADAVVRWSGMNPTGEGAGVGGQVADIVDRMLGTRVQALRLTSGAAVTA